MSETQAAVVQTLTAEVRTLVVGARQVTMSVAKQLDVVSLADLRVFGRVNIPKRGAIVIGAAPDGTLALAEIEYAGRFSPIVSGAASFAICRRLPGASWDGAQGYRLSLDGQGFWVNLRDTARCAQPHIDDGGWCNPTWRSDDDVIRAEIADQHAAWIKWRDLTAAADAAPLIVLAGLH